MNAARPEQFKTRAERIISHCRMEPPTMMQIPAIAAAECQMLLESYHGGKWRVIRYLFREWLYLRSNSVLWNARLWISDAVGWTKIYDVPETADCIAHQQRHGRKCSGSPNCDDLHCIDRSIPKWFRRLTRWDK